RFLTTCSSSRASSTIFSSVSSRFMFPLSDETLPLGGPAILSEPVRTRCLPFRHEGAGEVPLPGEPVERTAHDLARPTEEEGVRLRVVGPGDRRGEARLGAARLGRALVEVKLVPRCRPGLELTRD